MVNYDWHICARMLKINKTLQKIESDVCNLMKFSDFLLPIINFSKVLLIHKNEKFSCIIYNLINLLGKQLAYKYPAWKSIHKKAIISLFYWFLIFKKFFSYFPHSLNHSNSSNFEKISKFYHLNEISLKRFTCEFVQHEITIVNM